MQPYRGHERADFVAALLHSPAKFPAQKRTFPYPGRMERPPDIRIVSCSMPLLNVFLRFLCGPVQTSSVAVLADRNRCFLCLCGEENATGTMRVFALLCCRASLHESFVFRKDSEEERNRAEFARKDRRPLPVLCKDSDFS